MMLIEETPVPDLALPLDALKAHLRLGSGFGVEDLQDALLAGFLRAALAAIELRTGKALFGRNFRWSLPRWRDGQAQALPIAPAVQIAQLVIVDASGAEVIAAPQSYRLEADPQRPVLRAAATCLPTIPSGGQARVDFSAGFGAAWEDIPPDLRQAVMMLSAHYYEFRADTTLSEGCMPFGVSSLIDRYRALRLGGAG
ncbi:MAG: head-tail connector protein [Sulfitobacter sp.]